MRKLSMIAKCTLAALDSFKRVRRVDLHRPLTNFGFMIVLVVSHQR